MPIRILPQELINQIAAGEVVERPASVVKELVENSLDAKARNIVIEIENGGLNLVRVIDDGCGMSPDDALLSLAQHATSKIDCVDDLFNIATLGFRGEALASISSVSEFSLTTKKREELAGIEITSRGNQILKNQIGCPVGTTVTVKNLFYNVPARKKYLKTTVTEYNHIVDLFLNYVLAFEKISWTLKNNDRTVYQFAAVENLVTRIGEVLGSEIAGNFLPIDYNAVEMKISGFIGKPQIARNNRKLQYLFVNRRPVNDYVLAKQVKDAFGSLLMTNAYPVFILFLEIDTKKIDVNVHPRKMEVRFAEPQKIYSTVYRAVAQILDQSELTSQVKNVQSPMTNVKSMSANPNSNIEYRNPKQFPSLNFPNSKSIIRNSAAALGFNQKMVEPSAKIESPSADYKVIGQIAASYIIVETETSLKIIDQHAASERIQYEKIQGEWQGNKIVKQSLLLPDNLELTPSEANVVSEKLAVLVKFGFDLSELSGQTFMINAVPQVLASRDYKEALKDLIGKIVDAGDNDLEKENEHLDAILKMMACKSAIKFGDKLSSEEMGALVEKLSACKNSYTCAHGRPCVIEFLYDELEKMFKRKNV